VAKTKQAIRPCQDPDPLAAVVLHTLVSNAQEGFTLAQIATACQRDPAKPGELEEIQVAARVLLDDGLAENRNDLYVPTRAAIRASELSF
jgi:hypothetical protein